MIFNWDKDLWISRQVVMTGFSFIAPPIFALLGYIFDGQYWNDFMIGGIIGCLICTWIIIPILDYLE